MKVNRRNIIPVVKVTITTFSTLICRIFKIIIVGQEAVERTRSLSVEGQPTEADLAQICMSVFLFRKVSDTIFAKLSLPK
jgi:hypothetical protein